MFSVDKTVLKELHAKQRGLEGRASPGGPPGHRKLNSGPAVKCSLHGDYAPWTATSQLQHLQATHMPGH